MSVKKCESSCFKATLAYGYFLERNLPTEILNRTMENVRKMYSIGVASAGLENSKIDHPVAKALAEIAATIFQLTYTMTAGSISISPPLS
jgi:hypothetical protein